MCPIRPGSKKCSRKPRPTLSAHARPKSKSLEEDPVARRAGCGAGRSREHGRRGAERHGSRAAAHSTSHASAELAVHERCRIARSRADRADPALEPTEPGAEPHLRSRCCQGVRLVRRHVDAALGSHRLHRETTGRRGRRRRRLELRVRLSVQNESSRVQPLPLLRLTLQDRFGNAVATRDLEPADYLPSESPTSACSSLISASMPNCTSSIRARPRSASRSMPACAVRAAPSAAPTTRGAAPPAEPPHRCVSVPTSSARQ